MASFYKLVHDNLFQTSAPPGAADQWNSLYLTNNGIPVTAIGAHLCVTAGHLSVSPGDIIAGRTITHTLKGTSTLLFIVLDNSPFPTWSEPYVDTADPLDTSILLSIIYGPGRGDPVRDPQNGDILGYSMYPIDYGKRWGLNDGVALSTPVQAPPFFSAHFTDSAPSSLYTFPTDIGCPVFIKRTTDNHWLLLGIITESMGPVARLDRSFVAYAGYQLLSDGVLIDNLNLGIIPSPSPTVDRVIITSPLSGSQTTSSATWVYGTVSIPCDNITLFITDPLATPRTGYPAMITGNTFAGQVPLQIGTNEIWASAVYAGAIQAVSQPKIIQRLETPLPDPLPDYPPAYITVEGVIYVNKKPQRFSANLTYKAPL